MTLFQRSRDGLSLSIEGMTALDIVLEMDFSNCQPRPSPKRLTILREQCVDPMLHRRDCWNFCWRRGFRH